MSRVLVLDTNIFFFAPLPLVRRISETGYTLRVSIIGLEERLARAASEGLEKLRQRLRNVNPYMDQDRPISALGGPLYAQLQIRDQDPHRKYIYDTYNARLPELWRGLVATGELPNWELLVDRTKESIDRTASVARSAISDCAEA
ncbi:MAG TPA: hypothetical protein VGI39_46060, partial [Polyangiaceae bacterium]